jgi:hypothetical protein
MCPVGHMVPDSADVEFQTAAELPHPPSDDEGAVVEGVLLLSRCKRLATAASVPLGLHSLDNARYGGALSILIEDDYRRFE